MSDQVQCPNCGGYRVRDPETIGDFEERDPSSAEVGFSTILYLGAALFCGFLVWAAFYVAVGIILVMVGWRVTEGGELIGVATVIAIIPAAIVSFKYFRHLAHGVRRDKVLHRADSHLRYSCLLCGYEWDWRPGTARPTVTMRPELIAAGQQRLEEEQRQRTLQLEQLRRMTVREWPFDK